MTQSEANMLFSKYDYATAKSLKEVCEVVKSIKNSTVKVPDDTETK